VSDVNPEPRTVDEQMDRPTRGKPPELDLAELLKPPGHGRVIRNRKLDLEQVGQRPEEALGLTKRKMKDHADHQRSLDRDVRIDALASGFAAGRRTPGIERRIGEPDGQVATLLEARLVFSPISHPVLRLRVLVLAALRILHRLWLRVEDGSVPTCSRP